MQRLEAAFTEIEVNTSTSIFRMKELFDPVGGAKGEAPPTAGVGAGTKPFLDPETPSDLLAKWKDEFRQGDLRKGFLWAFQGHR